MPELTAIHLGLLVMTLISGLVLGWMLQSRRATKDKIAVNAGWQEQIESQRSEHQRLAEQNKGLMEQISQYQGSNQKTADQLTALQASLSESYNLRDQLQQQLKESRSSLRTTSIQRDRFKSAYDDIEARLNSTMSLLEKKDDKISRLKKELANWADRLPPLVEKFKLQNEEKDALRTQLDQSEQQLELLRNALDDANAAVEQAASLQKELADARVQVERIDELRGELADAQSQIAGIDALRDELETARAACADIDALREEVENNRTRADTIKILRTELARANHRIAQLDDMDFGGQTRVGAASPEALPDGMDASNEPHDDLSADWTAAPNNSEDDAEAIADDEQAGSADAPAEDALSPTAKPATEPAAPEPEDRLVADGGLNGSESAAEDPDDLQRIKGIGPAIARTLNELGIFRFAQIADMSEPEIDRIARHLKGFRSRIYREDWLGQARDLQYQKDRHPN